MTTVAYDGVTLAADLCVNDGDLHVRFAGKLKRLKNGDRAGFAGDLYGGIALLAWLDTNRDGPTGLTGSQSDTEALVITKAGRVEVYNYKGIMVDFDEEKFAMGSGADLAWGALLAGANAERAIEIACERDPGSNFGVICLR